MLNKFLSNKFLFEELVARDFKKKYKRSILGMGWSIFSPLCTLLVMRVVFTQLFGRNIEHFTTYLFCGNLLFSYFSDSTTQGMSSFTDNAHIFSKVNAPKYLFLFAKNVQCLINFFLTLIVFALFCLFDGITFHLGWLLLLYPIVMLALFNLGVGLLLASMYAFFSDVKYLWSIFLQLLVYASAIFYPISEFAPEIQQLFLLNPLYHFILYFRQIVLNCQVPSFELHGLILLDVVLALSISYFVYRKVNHQFLYYL